MRHLARSAKGMRDTAERVSRDFVGVTRLCRVRESPQVWMDRLRSEPDNGSGHGSMFSRRSEDIFQASRVQDLQGPLFQLIRASAVYPRFDLGREQAETLLNQDMQ